MVHVGVSNQDKVDGGHLLDSNAGTPLTAQNDEPGNENRVDEHIATTDLEEEGGVSDEGDPELTGGD
jgi:hypothetical protein